MRNAIWILLLIVLTTPGAPRSAESEESPAPVAPGEFVPSESISADKAISFPVDI